MATKKQLFNRKEFAKAVKEYYKLVFKHLPSNTMTGFYFSEIHEKIKKDIDSNKAHLLDISEEDNAFAMLRDNGYITHDVSSGNPDYSVMTEKGITAKKLGGHNEYERFIRQQLNINNYQRKVNCWLIVIGALSIVAPMLIEFSKQKRWVFNEKQQQPLYEIRDTVVVQIDSPALKKSILIYTLPPIRKIQ